MDHVMLLTAIGAGIFISLLLILYFKIHAFVALSVASVVVGMLAGMSPLEIMTGVQKGMGETLGFVAGVIGLGAILGGILEHSGGAQALGQYLLKVVGEKNAPWALMMTGLILTVAIFFNVAFIILAPMVFAVQRQTEKPLLWSAIPLLAGMSVSHAFIPPASGPLAVSEIIGADLGYVIITGLAAGIPAAVMAGPLYGKWISKKIRPVSSVSNREEHTGFSSLPSPGWVVFLIGIPIMLIVFTTCLNSPWGNFLNIPIGVKAWMKLIGHPFTALIIVNILAWYVLGIRKGFSKERLADISGKSLAPAGVIILITGAGGIFKQILTDAGTGHMVGEMMLATGTSYIVCAFFIAGFIRALQGSTTVAMITAAGMMASLISDVMLSPLEKALIVSSISCGGILFSHVTDSGFWLVKQYLGLSEKHTLASWSVMTSIVALVGFIMILLIQFFIV